jgi:hypothetical protein
MRSILLLAFVFCAPALSAADEQVDCSASCPTGEVMVSYADGNNTTCVCVPAALMDETVPNTEPVEGEGTGA